MDYQNRDCKRGRGRKHWMKKTLEQEEFCRGCVKGIQQLIFPHKYIRQYRSGMKTKVLLLTLLTAGNIINWQWINIQDCIINWLKYHRILKIWILSTRGHTRRHVITYTNICVVLLVHIMYWRFFIEVFSSVAFITHTKRQWS